ncbi:transcriptional antiterminator NusG [Methylobacterium sp. RAS18]|nr:transcriptional antiterminator NusG [Methylobacterium sp. RAS18]
MTNKQRRARRRMKAKEKRRQNVRKATAVNMQTVRAGLHTEARQDMPRFEVDLERTWYVVRTLPRWAARAAEQIRAEGIPVFEARESIRLVSEIGKVRTALVPVLNRLLFVGVVPGAGELKRVEEHPGVYDDHTTYRRGGVMRSPGGMQMTISAEEMQNFADAITGNGGDAARARKVLFEIGQAVVVEAGPFASFNATIEEIDDERERLRVAVEIFGRATPVELDFKQVRAA